MLAVSLISVLIGHEGDIIGQTDRVGGVSGLAPGGYPAGSLRRSDGSFSGQSRAKASECAYFDQ